MSKLPNFLLNGNTYWILSILVILVAVITCIYLLPIDQVSTKEILKLVALPLLSSLLSLRIQAILNEEKEKRTKRMQLIHTLFSTAARKISHDHTLALNLLALEYQDDEKVSQALKNYTNHLKTGESYTGDWQGWNHQADDCLFDLITKLYVSLGFNAGHKALKDLSYYPSLLRYKEISENEILFGVAKWIRKEFKPAFEAHVTHYVEKELDPHDFEEFSFQGLDGLPNSHNNAR